MALGCAFIFLLVLMLCRRRMRKRRAKHTDAWAEAKRLDHKKSWRWRLLHAGEKFFGHRASSPPISLDGVESEETKLTKMRKAEEARAHLDDIIGAYEYSREGSTRSSRSSNTPSVLPSFAGERNIKRDPRNLITEITRGSMYSVVTGKPRTAPEPRQPVNKNLLLPLRGYRDSEREREYRDSDRGYRDSDRGYRDSDRGYRNSQQSSVSSVTHVGHPSYNPASKAPLGVDVAPIVPEAPLVDVKDPSDAQAYARLNNPFRQRLEGSF